MGHSGRGRGRGRAGAVDSPPAPSVARFASATPVETSSRRSGSGSAVRVPSEPEQSGVDFSVLFLFKGLQGGKFSCPAIRRYFGRSGSGRVVGPTERTSDSLHGGKPFSATLQLFHSGGSSAGVAH